MAIRVTVWNENLHEQKNPAVAAIYPKGMHGAIAEGLADAGMITRTATLDEPEHGLTEEVLRDTDVLVWWGHIAHAKVEDAVVARIIKRVQEGMGLVVLHSGLGSKLFRSLVATEKSEVVYRPCGEPETLWVVNKAHPVAQDLPFTQLELPHEPTYGEIYDIAKPDELVFISWFENADVFRSGYTYTRGEGRIFYFGPGHEEYPIYYRPEIRQVITRAVRWTAKEL